MARPRTLWSEIRFFVALALIALVLRGFVFATFVIPSESMLPRLFVGDYLVVTKWPYGWSRYSLPGALPFWSGRIGAKLPTRGDVVVFKAPPSQRVDYIKRVIGLPGDRVAMRGGQVILNGVAIPKLRVADLLVPVSPNSPCRPEQGAAIVREREPDGSHACRYHRYRETLPGGRAYDVLDMGNTTADDRDEMVVPADRLFLMGDNRDRSADSRFPAQDDGGIGLVPIENLVGRAQISVFSTDGSASWTSPASWLRAARTHRIGKSF
ncbi:signal peptidase I [Sphingomonas naphthae]|uniref:Signal peptidase I n=1 Tax=Sphingomonas naphthae TaxID=1813468 RepID=A0ABY7TNV6_9SPHN|nr:signal peptidase I [Sphingomonas naphthae]WCT74917.1 signal peptidase I [Sphingomonas naphthae]